MAGQARLDFLSLCLERSRQGYSYTGTGILAKSLRKQSFGMRMIGKKFANRRLSAQRDTMVYSAGRHIQSIACAEPPGVHTRTGP